MTYMLPIPLAAPPRAWVLWISVLALAVLAGLLVAWLRRWLLRPMRHRPSSTTDAWAEAGRRFHVPDAAQEDEDASAGGNGDSA